jgi:hypothetical protein
MQQLVTVFSMALLKASVEHSLSEDVQVSLAEVIVPAQQQLGVLLLMQQVPSLHFLTSMHELQPKHEAVMLKRFSTVCTR